MYNSCLLFFVFLLIVFTNFYPCANHDYAYMPIIGIGIAPATPTCTVFDYSGCIPFGFVSCDCKVTYNSILYIYNIDYLNSIIIFLYFLFIHSFFQETHILHEFKEDFYGANLQVCVVGYIRPEKTFDSLGLSFVSTLITCSLSFIITSPSYYLFNLCISQCIINIHLSTFIISYVLL